MSRTFSQPAQNYHDINDFKEKAIKTLNDLFGKKKPFDVFDFSEDEKDGLKYFNCVAYHDGEKIPEEQKSGEPLSEEQASAQTEAAKIDEDADDEDEVVIHCTTGARILAMANSVDLSKVKGTGKDGKIQHSDVTAYLKEKADGKVG